MTLKKLPKIIHIETLAKSRLFEIQALDLHFSNGVERRYERMKPSGRNAVMLVPVTEKGEFILIREYAAGTERYELGFPKGLIDEGENAIEAGNRELKEEIGFGAHTLTPLKEVVLAPSYFSSKMTLLLAQDLYEEKLEGDEPEPLELVYWPIAYAEELLSHLDFCESRSITALFLALKKLNLPK